MGLHFRDLLAVLSIFVESIAAYGNGQVTVACDSMIPKHGSIIQKSPSPAIITVDKNVINASDQIRGTG